MTVGPCHQTRLVPTSMLTETNYSLNLEVHKKTVTRPIGNTPEVHAFL